MNRQTTSRIANNHNQNSLRHKYEPREKANWNDSFWNGKDDKTMDIDVSKLTHYEKAALSMLTDLSSVIGNIEVAQETVGEWMTSVRTAGSSKSHDDLWEEFGYFPLPTTAESQAVSKLLQTPTCNLSRVFRISHGDFTNEALPLDAEWWIQFAMTHAYLKVAKKARDDGTGNPTSASSSMKAAARLKEILSTADNLLEDFVEAGQLAGIRPHGGKELISMIRGSTASEKFGRAWENYKRSIEDLSDHHITDTKKAEYVVGSLLCFFESWRYADNEQDRPQSSEESALERFRGIMTKYLENQSPGSAIDIKKLERLHGLVERAIESSCPTAANPHIHIDRFLLALSSTTT